MDAAVGKLQLQLQDELVDHPGDDRRRQVAERNHRIEAVAKFRREHLADGVLLDVLAARCAEADAFARHVGRAGVGGHDQDGVPEIDGLAVVVGELAVVHHLQKDVEQVGVRLFDLVEQKHAVRLLVDGVGEQSALVVADIARGRADQPTDRMAFHIFGHVEALQRDAEHRSELPGDLRLADAGRAGEQIVADRLVGLAKPGAAELDRRGELLDGKVLPEDDALEVGFEVLEDALVVGATDSGGIRAIVATTASISLAVMTFLRRLGGTSICMAPTSSITSIALSGSLRSWM